MLGGGGEKAKTGKQNVQPDTLCQNSQGISGSFLCGELIRIDLGIGGVLEYCAGFA